MRRTISLFTGVGGLDLGLEAAGFAVAVAVEIDREAVHAIRKNRDWTIVEHDGRPLPIEAIDSRTLLKAGGLSVGGAALLVGGPPCQPFSKSGYWASGDALRLRDPRANTLREYFRVLRDTLPEAFLLENVPGLKFEGKDEGLLYIDRRLRDINRWKGTNYTFTVAQLNAADFGVPQLRERVFVIGHRDGRHFDFPDAQYGSSSEPYLNAWDAIADLQDDYDQSLQMTGRWADLLPSIPEGHNYLWHTARGGGRAIFGWRTRYWSFLLKLAKNRPSWTLQAQPGPAIGPFHWKNRRLSTREMCRLQTMPDAYVVTGNLRTAQRLLGNAVPSALAEILGLEIRRQLLCEKGIPEAPTLLPHRAPNCPPAEEVEAIQRKYRHLIGRHRAHPGTGLGPAARRRKRRAANKRWSPSGHDRRKK